MTAFGELKLKRLFTVQRESVMTQWLQGYVYQKMGPAIAKSVAVLPGMPKNIDRWIGREIAFQKDFPVVPYDGPLPEGALIDAGAEAVANGVVDQPQSSQ